MSDRTKLFGFVDVTMFRDGETRTYRLFINDSRADCVDFSLEQLRAFHAAIGAALDAHTSWPAHEDAT